MDDSQATAPELSVKTEYVRQSSESYDKSLVLPQAMLADNCESSSVFSETPQFNISAIEKRENALKAENIPRNDSYTKFGHMEIVNLDVSEQEVPTTQLLTSAEISSACDVERNVTVDTSNVLDSFDLQSNVEDQSITTVSISSYFTREVKQPPTTAAVGTDFFDELTKDDSAINATALNETSTNEVKEIETVKQTPYVQNPVENVATEAFEKDKIKESDSKETPSEPPPFFKFFSEDKSGTDVTGKEFFDKIATEGSNAFEAPKISPDANTQNNDSSNSVFSSEQLLDSAFLNSLNNELTSEVWLPSEQTRQILIARVTSSPGGFIPKKEYLTVPDIIIEEEMEDPLKIALTEANSPLAQQRKALTKNDVPANIEGVLALIKANCYHAAINLIKQLLESTGSTSPGISGNIRKHTPLELQLWFLRIALFIKLKKFSFAEVESAAFGDLDKPDLYYEFYPEIYGNKKGSMVPFSFRLLVAELPQYQGNHQIALDNLYRILSVVQKIISNLQDDKGADGTAVTLSDEKRKQSLNLWYHREQRVLYSVLNCVLSQKDYIMAVTIAKMLMEKDKEHCLQLYSALGRIYLQLGDIKKAQECFTEATLQNGNDTKDSSFEVEHLINKALLAIAYNENDEAYKFYEQAFSLQPNNPMLANNMAVCLLYMGRLKESLSLLEQTVQKNPQSCLHDGILFNICTLYELESSQSTLKKYAMLDLVSKHAGDNFNISCLKIQPNSRG